MSVSVLVQTKSIIIYNVEKALSFNSKCQYLERFDTGSCMTMQSVTSPNALKYSCKPSVIKGQTQVSLMQQESRARGKNHRTIGQEYQAGFNRKYLSMQLG